MNRSRSVSGERATDDQIVSIFRTTTRATYALITSAGRLVLAQVADLPVVPATNTLSLSSGVKADELIGSFVDIGEAAQEVGNICNAYNAIDIDFTVILTHIGFEEDRKLAALLDPAWGVDVIIGGHSHSFMTEPDYVNGIYIVQAGTGTDQIGRFDIMVDTDLNAIDTFTWELIPINDQLCPKDEEMERYIN